MEPALPPSGRARTQDIAVAAEERVDFSALLLPDPILKGIRDMGWVHPSPVQLKSIPVGRFGSDLIAQAKSGTGKTGVFAIVALSHIDIAPQVLILEPTREIAQQSCQVINALGKHIQGLQCKTFIGGVPLDKDAASLRNCHIAVGTPGRILQLQEDKRLRSATIGLVILDEADKLFESPMDEQVVYVPVHAMQGFNVDSAIVKQLRDEKQVLALSATFTEETLERVKELTRHPQMVMLTPDTPSLKGVRQYFCRIPEATASTPAHIFAAKVAKLLTIFSRTSFHQCLLFTNDRGRVDALRRRMQEEGWPSAYIAGGLAQSERTAAITALRDFKIRVLVSTDLTARGIDVDRVNLVVNLDMPHDPETYLHRIGRTGTLGVAISFVDRHELKIVRQIVDSYNTTIDELPDEIPPELYTFELASEKDKQAAKRLEVTREANKDNARPMDVREFVSVPKKRRREVEVEGEGEHAEDGELEANAEWGVDESGEAVADVGDGEEEEEEEEEVAPNVGGDDGAPIAPAQGYPHLMNGFNHWAYAPHAVLGAFGGGGPGFAQAAAWFWAGYGYAIQATQQYYAQRAADQ